jgi:hypothetical protein
MERMRLAGQHRLSIVNPERYRSVGEGRSGSPLSAQVHRAAPARPAERDPDSGPAQAPEARAADSSAT